MIKKILALLMAFIFALNFSAVTCAKTLEQKEAEKAAKLQKKQEKQIRKAARENNIKIVEEWANEGDRQAQFIFAYAKQTGQRIRKDKPAAAELFAQLKKADAYLVENFIPVEYYGKKVKLSRLYGIAACNSQLGKYVGGKRYFVIGGFRLGVLHGARRSPRLQTGDCIFEIGER